MSYDFLKSVEEDGSQFPSLLDMGIGLAPLFIGAKLSADKLSSNLPISQRGPNLHNPLPPSPVLPGGSYSEVLGRSLGKKLKAGAQAKIAAEFMKKDEILAFLNKMEERNALVASLLDTMQDPSFTMPEFAQKGFKEELTKLANEMGKDQMSEEVKELVTKLVSTV